MSMSIGKAAGALISSVAPSLHIHAEITSLGSGDPAQVMQNVAQGLTNLAQAAETALKSLTAVTGGASAPPPSAPAAAPGAFAALGSGLSADWSAKFSQMAQLGSVLDNMEKEAMEKLKSPKKEDQIQGQQMMAAMQQIMEAIIKAIQSTASMAKSAIDGSQAR